MTRTAQRVLVLCMLTALAGARGGAAAEPTPADLDGIPSASREDVTRLLRKVRHKYGDDAIVIETNLLLNAMRNGSLLASGVRVEGVEDYDGKRYLGFHVETGLVFDDYTRDELARLHVLWVAILEPTLERLTALRVPADGIKVEMQYHHRPYRTLAELRDSIAEPGVSEEASFYLLTTDVDELVGRRVPARHLIGRSRVSVDGSERRVVVPQGELPTAPGPQ